MDQEVRMAIPQKRRGLGLEMRSFAGRHGNSYLVFRTSGGSFHVFVEVEAKEAARQCGATNEANTRQMWSEGLGQIILTLPNANMEYCQKEARIMISEHHRSPNEMAYCNLKPTIDRTYPKGRFIAIHN